MLLAMDVDRQFYGVYVESATPVVIEALPGVNSTRQEPLIVFRSMGGHINLNILTGPTPADVVNQLTSYVGRPRVPPRWALGYHVCRDTGNEDDFRRDLDELESYGIPYDSDCIDEQLLPTAFEVNAVRYSLEDDVDMLLRKDKKLMLSLPPQISVDSDFYDRQDSFYIMVGLFNCLYLEHSALS